jgi:DNA-binding NarL/FixJ family response regulator
MPLIKLMKLLIIDDSPQVRQVLRTVVLDLADEVFECDGGAQALDAYTVHQPDWVLMDIQMNEVDGLTATRQIKAAFPDARVVIVTNYDDAALREAAEQAGASGYVIKENLLNVYRILA